MLEDRSVHESYSNAIFASTNKGAVDIKWMTISPKYAGLSKYGDISKHLFSLSEKGGITVSNFFLLNFNGDRNKKPFDKDIFLFSQEKLLSVQYWPCFCNKNILSWYFDYAPWGDVIISCFPDVLVFLNHTFSLAVRPVSKMKNVIPSNTALLSPQEVFGFCSLQTWI